MRLAGGGLTFLLRDDFITAASAPLTSPRTAEPGPGTLTITDTGNNLSISSGGLQVANGTSAWGDPGIRSVASFARLAGRAAVINFTVTGSAKFAQFGWDDNASGELLVSTYFSNGTVLKAYDNGTLTGNLDAYGQVAYKLAVVLRATGAFHFIKGGTFTDWTLIWVGNAGTATPLYAAWLGYTLPGTLDNFRVLDLPAPFGTDYGIATDREVGAVSAGTTFTHEANCVIEWTQTTVPSAGETEVFIRVQDASNYWRVMVTSAGTFILYEVVAGTPTSRASAATVVSNGHRIVIVADGTTIRGYSNNVLRWTYSSASNFATETDGELDALGTGGAVSDVVAWPRTLSGVAAAYLNAAVA